MIRLILKENQFMRARPPLPFALPAAFHQDFYIGSHQLGVDLGLNFFLLLIYPLSAVFSSSGTASSMVREAIVPGRVE